VDTEKSLLQNVVFVDLAFWETREALNVSEEKEFRRYCWRKQGNIPSIDKNVNIDYGMSEVGKITLYCVSEWVYRKEYLY